MDPLRVLAARQGFFSRRQACDLGYDDRAVTRCVRGRAWTRFRRGYYAFTDVWQATDPAGRHRIRSAAVMHSLGDAVALSHVSGVLQHGIATWDVDLSRVHVTRLDTAPGRIEGDVVHHEGRWVADDIVEVGGQRVLVPERCVLEAGSRVDAERSLVMLDSGLHLERFEDDALCRRFQSMSGWPWMRSMHVPVRMARSGAQSPGETRGRYHFWLWHLPAPLLQYAVRDASGALLGTTDWAWPEHGVLGEFDGRAKYGRLLKPGQDVGEVVFAEKQREDLLREVTDFRMIRVVWQDFERPHVLEARLRRALQLPAA